MNNGTNDVGSEDEVKVYNAEDETEDQNGEESVQDGLQEEKTSLISEQVRKEKSFQFPHIFFWPKNLRNPLSREKSGEKNVKSCDSLGYRV